MQLKCVDSESYQRGSCSLALPVSSPSPGPSCSSLPSPQPVILWFLFCLFDTVSHHVAEAGITLAILLPWSLMCWDYRCVPPCLAHLTSDKEDR